MIIGWSFAQFYIMALLLSLTEWFPGDNYFTDPSEF
jgi:hypothetical protein